jgi:S-adenosylmethionine:tRNA ribosyltransferase-isomerase
MTEIRTGDFEYELPDELIAYTPAEERHESRLLVLNRLDRSIEHVTFERLPDYLGPGDLVVANDTKVIKARLEGKKRETGGRVEVLLVREIDPGRWEALVSPSRRIHAGTEITVGGKYACRITERLEGAKRLVEFRDVDVPRMLDDVGQVPLPPYIKRAPEDFDVERYQTVYARKAGSVAAPTAGLHFSEDLLGDIKRKGVEITYLTLHVGPGTFVPVKADDPRQHVLEPEYFEVDAHCCDSINRVKKQRGRVLAVGTTSVRTLETVADRSRPGPLDPQNGWTHKFIMPPYEFKVVDLLLTNFHLPRSTLLMLVCAFGDRDLIMKAYNEAVKQKYRFFSYGDAMLVV